MQVDRWMNSQMSNQDGACAREDASAGAMWPYFHEDFVEDVAFDLVNLASEAGFSVRDVNALKADVGMLVHRSSQWTPTLVSRPTPISLSTPLQANKSRAPTPKKTSYVARTRGQHSNASGKSE
jgi:hypothetical protein